LRFRFLGPGSGLIGMGFIECKPRLAIVMIIIAVGIVNSKVVHHTTGEHNVHPVIRRHDHQLMTWTPTQSLSLTSLSRKQILKETEWMLMMQ